MIRIHENFPIEGIYFFFLILAFSLVYSFFLYIKRTSVLKNGNAGIAKFVRITEEPGSFRTPIEYYITYSYHDENGTYRIVDDQHPFREDELGKLEQLKQIGYVPIKFKGAKAAIVLDSKGAIDLRSIMENIKEAANIDREPKSTEGIHYIVIVPVDLRTEPVLAAHNSITFLSQGTKLILLEKGEKTIIDNTEGYWVKVQENFYGIGWCFSGNLEEV
ncbi:MAG: SH3 domain-containing protein [Treponema sp.]|nr:SH3 domain-containing protein [Treponema sp.]